MQFEDLIHRARSILFYKNEREAMEFLVRHTSRQEAYLAVKAAKLMNGYWLEGSKTS